MNDDQPASKPIVPSPEAPTAAPLLEPPDDRPPVEQDPQLQGVEPVAALDMSVLPSRPRSIASGVRLNIRGRSVHLRGLHRAPSGYMKWLLILGPGLIATSAGNDAGGIATYSQAGAQFGYQLIWVMIVLTVAYAVIQEMCARLGAATGRGLLDLVRERFGVGWASFAIIVVLLANGGVTISEFFGIGAAVELFGLNKYFIMPIAAAVLWYLVIFGSYAYVEKVFIALTLVFFAYPVAAFLSHPHWGEVARGAFVPTIHRDPDYIFVVVGLLGTTVTPYIQIFQQSALVEKGVARRHYGPERIDAFFGAFFSNVMSVAMIIATAATLHVIGKTQISTAADAAKALEPVAGHAAKALFAIGLIGASLLAGAILPLATAYAVSEVLGVPKGVNLDFRRAPLFFTLFTAMIVIGAACAMIPNVPVIKLLLAVQVLNGVLLPIILIFILLLINDKELTGDLKNSRRYNWLAWGVFVLITTAVVVMLGTQVLQWTGVIHSK